MKKLTKRLPLVALLAATAVLYIWGLSKDGWANSFYSAAVQAGSHSWKAFFFGSSDAANSITVDKTPGALWPMEIAARIFGVNSWSILVPQALEGVASVWVLYLAVKRWFGEGAGLIAGAVLALTPVAALMFRFNNPDALLVLMLIAATYATTRALEGASTKWIMLAGMFVGFNFLAKMMQAFLLIPVLGAVYLISAPTPIKRRIWQLGASLGTLLVAGGWWVAIVELWPKSSRPYIGGSQTNSVLDLMFGYNGFGRLSGNENGSVGGGGPGGGNGGSMWGSTGITRLFSNEMGTQISWLLPAALILLVAAAVVVWRLPIRKRVYQAFGMWGGWLIVTGAAFSFGQGIIHPYYTVALAPAIGALIAIGGFALWKMRQMLISRVSMAIALVATGWWGYVLLGRTDWNSWLKTFIVILCLGAAGLFLGIHKLNRKFAFGFIAVALAGSMSAPAAYALQTAGTAHSGSIPSAGPGSSGFGPGTGGGGGRPGGGNFTPPNGTNGTGQRPFGLRNNNGAPPNFPGNGGRNRVNPFAGGTGGPGTNGGAPTGGGPGGGAGGLLNASTPSQTIVDFLKAHKGNTTWVLATIGSNEASGYQLATNLPVMPIGGFNGSDPSPTLAQFKQLVSERKIAYFVASGRGFGSQMGGSNASQEISSWVQANFKTVDVGGTTFYDLSSGNAATTS